ncbi:Gfo/Idh/MocA family protein [Saccharophagus degradans]|nr:Gfo/Idh/MocA family oxidoreductase [Saccharophagus degradans]
MNSVIMKKLGIACWTIGQHAQKNIIPAIKRCDSVELIGAYTRNEAILGAVCSQTGCKRYADEQELLSDSAVGLVYLSSPTGVHYEQIKKCITAKKSVLVEKTALTSADQVDELLEMARANEVLVMEAFMYRFHSQFKALQELLDFNRYGEIVRIECEFGFPHLPKNDIRYSKVLEGGALYDAGAYTLSAARILLGCNPKVEWAHVLFSKEFEVDVGGHAILSNDINQIAICNWRFGASYINQIRIWLERGHLLVERAFSKPDSFDSQITIKNNGALIEKINCGPDNHFVEMFNYASELISLSEFEIEYRHMADQVDLLGSVLNFKEGR